MSQLPTFPVEGGCVCGAVRYRLSGPPLGVYDCHCKDCQRSAGSAFSTSMPIPAELFAVVAGTTQIYDKTADSGRIVRQHSCGICGTRLFNEPLSNKAIRIVRPGTLDDSSWALPVGNIWVNSKAPWVEIDPTAPSYPGQPPTREALFEAWRRRLAEPD